MERIDEMSSLHAEILEAITAAVVLQRLFKKAEKWRARKMPSLHKIDTSNADILKMDLTKLRAFQDMAIEIKRRYRILEAEINDILNHGGLIKLAHHKYSEYFLENLHDALLDDLQQTKERMHTKSFLANHLSHINRLLKILRKDRDLTRKKVGRLKTNRDKIITENND